MGCKWPVCKHPPSLGSCFLLLVQEYTVHHQFLGVHIIWIPAKNRSKKYQVDIIWYFKQVSVYMEILLQIVVEFWGFLKAVIWNPACRLSRQLYRWESQIIFWTFCAGASLAEAVSDKNCNQPPVWAWERSSTLF